MRPNKTSNISEGDSSNLNIQQLFASMYVVLKDSNDKGNDSMEMV